MAIDFDVKIECDQCEKIYHDVKGYNYCYECSEKMFDDAFEEAIKEAASNNYHWTDKEGYTGWDKEEEMEIFMRGIREGFFSALFHIASYRNLLRLWEELDEKSIDEIKETFKEK